MNTEEKTIIIHEDKEAVLQEVQDREEEGVVRVDENDEEGTLYLEDDIPQEFIDMFHKDNDVEE
jgi:hypothetical protein